MHDFHCWEQTGSGWRDTCVFIQPDKKKKTFCHKYIQAAVSYLPVYSVWVCRDQRQIAFTQPAVCASADWKSIVVDFKRQVCALLCCDENNINVNINLMSFILTDQVLSSLSWRGHITAEHCDAAVVAFVVYRTDNRITHNEVGKWHQVSGSLGGGPLVWCRNTEKTKDRVYTTTRQVLGPFVTDVNIDQIDLHTGWSLSLVLAPSSVRFVNIDPNRRTKTVIGCLPPTRCCLNLVFVFPPNLIISYKKILKKTYTEDVPRI